MQPEIRFLVDAQLPPRLAARLSAAGYPSLHVTEQLAATTSDSDIAELANAAVLISKDEDFLDLLARKVLLTALVWVRLGNLDNGRLWRVIEPIIPEVMRRLESGQQLVEIPLIP